MTPSRRTLLGGLLATLAAPAIIRTPGLLMPVRVPFEDYWTRFHRNAVAALNEYDRVNPFMSYFADEYQFRLPQGIRVMHPDGQTTWHKLMPL